MIIIIIIIIIITIIIIIIIIILLLLLLLLLLLFSYEPLRGSRSRSRLMRRITLPQKTYKNCSKNEISELKLQ